MFRPRGALSKRPDHCFNLDGLPEARTDLPNYFLGSDYGPRRYAFFRNAQFDDIRYDLGARVPKGLDFRVIRVM